MDTYTAHHVYISSVLIGHQAPYMTVFIVDEQNLSWLSSSRMIDRDSSQKENEKYLPVLTKMPDRELKQ